jgi:hypothetical protein
MRTTGDFTTRASPDFLLASDLDGTLIPPAWSDENRGALERFATMVDARRATALAYATGRDLELALSGIQANGLPIPDVLICDVGTRIYHRDAEARSYAEDVDYSAALESAVGSDMNIRVRARIDGLSGFKPQVESAQGRFKVSFHVDPAVDEARVVSEALEKLGPEAGAFNVVFSVDSIDGHGLLDVLPAGVSKNSATRHVRRLLDLDDRRVLFAGDSGNDAEILLGGVNAVLVGNASESLRRYLRDESRRLGVDDRVYFARADYAGGVIEGCRHFGLLDFE